MSVYFIANIKITNEQEYQKYIDKVNDVFSKFKGQYLVVDNSPTVLEGEWDYTRNVLIEFPDEKEFEAWYKSEEYQSILKHRLHGAKCDTILVKS